VSNALQLPSILHDNENTTEDLFTRLRMYVITSNPYFQKDLRKARQATKFIGRGSLASSTNRYREAASHFANSGVYTRTDRVFVSVEGARRGRIALDIVEVDLAISAGATLVSDVGIDRQRPYNVGERELAFHLGRSGYYEVSPGVWAPVG
jgi:hypothetical protein